MVYICAVNTWRAYQIANPDEKLSLSDVRRKIFLLYLSKKTGSTSKRRGLQGNKLMGGRVSTDVRLDPSNHFMISVLFRSIHHRNTEISQIQFILSPMVFITGSCITNNIVDFDTCFTNVPKKGTVCRFYTKAHRNLKTVFPFMFQSCYHINKFCF
ncbi:hypothetical protein TNIN_471101 [Trichonephila inaurata madagascariensis]|uniref:Uncharacterized protein n=1 Tax=Trichonephila inaurata madagascariensis TaxID=2747483 RepID=A0A8X6YMU3_9ARAC|nr:hypothetical protein TNIN_471101 [Trichonephila inaurata madagascariensis]